MDKKKKEEKARSASGSATTMLSYPWEYLSGRSGVCDPKEVLRWDPLGRLSVGQAGNQAMGWISFMM